MDEQGLRGERQESQVQPNGPPLAPPGDDQGLSGERQASQVQMQPNGPPLAPPGDDQGLRGERQESQVQPDGPPLAPPGDDQGLRGERQKSQVKPNGPPLAPPGDDQSTATRAESNSSGDSVASINEKGLLVQPYGRMELHALMATSYSSAPQRTGTTASAVSSIAFHPDNQEGLKGYLDSSVEEIGDDAKHKVTPKLSTKQRRTANSSGSGETRLMGSSYRAIPLNQRPPQNTMDNDPITQHPGATSNNTRFIEGMACTLNVGDKCRFCCEGLFGWVGDIAFIDDSDPRNVMYYADFSKLPHYVPSWDQKPYPRHKISKFFDAADTTDLDRCLVRGHPLSNILSRRGRMKKGVVVQLCDGTCATVYYNDPTCWRIGVKLDNESKIVHRLTYLKVLVLDPPPEYLANYAEQQLNEKAQSSSRKRAAHGSESARSKMAKTPRSSSSGGAQLKAGTSGGRNASRTIDLGGSGGSSSQPMGERAAWPPRISWMERKRIESSSAVRDALAQARGRSKASGGMKGVVEGKDSVKLEEDDVMIVENDVVVLENKLKVVEGEVPKESEKKVTSDSHGEGSNPGKDDDWSSKVADLRKIADETITQPIINALLATVATKPTDRIETPHVSTKNVLPTAPIKAKMRLTFGESTSASTNVSAVVAGVSSSAADTAVVGGVSSSAADNAVAVCERSEIQQPKPEERSGIGGGATVMEVDEAEKVHHSDNRSGSDSDNEQEKLQEAIVEELTSDSIAQLKRLDLSNSFLQTESGSTALHGPTSFTQQLVESVVKVAAVEVVSKEVGLKDTSAPAEGEIGPTAPTSFTQQLVESVVKVAAVDVVSKEVGQKDTSATAEGEIGPMAPTSFTQQLEESVVKVAAVDVVSKEVGQKDTSATAEGEIGPTAPTSCTQQLVKTVDKPGSSANSSANGTVEEGGWNVSTDGVVAASVSQSALFTENDAKALDYKMKLPLTAAMVAPVRSYLTKPKMPIMSSTLKREFSPILGKLHSGAIVGPLSVSPVRYDEDGDTNDAFRLVNESFMAGNGSDDDDGKDEQFCPFEVLYDEKNNCRKSFNMAVAQKIWENNPLMQFSCDVKGVCCLKLTVGSMIWVDASFDEASLGDYDAAALEASAAETSPNDKLGAYLSQMFTDFYKPFPTPADLAYIPSIRKTTKRKRTKDLALDQRPPFDAMVSLAVKRFSFDGVPVGDTHVAIMSALCKLQKKVTNAVRFGRLSFLGIDPKSAAAAIDDF